MLTNCAYCNKEINRSKKHKNNFCSTLHSRLFKIDECKKMTKEERSLRFTFRK